MVGEFQFCFTSYEAETCMYSDIYASFFFLPEKVHFQHTAKFIAQLINERANYTLQVSETWLCCHLLCNYS